MYKIEENIPKVIAFPTDKKVRAVLAYGALIHNQNNESNIPKVEVLLKEIDENNNLKDVPLIVKIEFTEIDIVRIGTIWQGRNRLNDRWKTYKDYKENVEFRFDFTINQPECIKYIDKNPKNNNYYFTKEIYDLNDIQSKYGLKYHFANATYTKLTTNTETTVLIHGLEFLTSTYVPQEKNIRGKLLCKPIDSILDEYIEEDSFIKDDIYYMHFKENKKFSNKVFLSYAKYNQITRNRLNRLRTSLESGSSLNDRYPVVLPYHPEKMRIIADGTWLDSETFLVFCIKGCSLPKENALRIKKTKELITNNTVTNKVESEDELGDYDNGDSTKENESQYIDPSEVDIDSAKRPHKRNQSLQIVSEVTILDEDDVDVSYTEEIKPKNNYRYKTEFVPKNKESTNIEDAEKTKNNEKSRVDTASSGDPSQSDKDKNTTSFEVLSNIEKSEMLVLVEEALRDMKKNKDAIDDRGKVYINKLSYLNEKCLESDSDKKPKFYTFINPDIRTDKTWCTIKNDKKEEDYRRFMLIKIVLNNGLHAYLLEIDRRSASESFSGFIFNYFNQDISEDLLKNLIKEIIKNKGKYSKRDKDRHRMIDLLYPVDIQKIYGHQTIKNSVYEKIKQVIKEAYFEDLFLSL